MKSCSSSNFIQTCQNFHYTSD